MRIRVFDADDFDHGGLHDFDADHIPNVGDLLSLEYGTGNVTHMQVTSRMFRISEGRGAGEVFYVALAARKVPSDQGLARYCR